MESLTQFDHVIFDSIISNIVWIFRIRLKQINVSTQFNIILAYLPGFWLGFMACSSVLTFSACSSHFQASFGSPSQGPNLVSLSLGMRAEITPCVRVLVSSSRALFPLPFTSTCVEDVGVEATVCAGVGVSTLLAFVKALRRAGGFGFGAAFPLGDLGV